MDIIQFFNEQLLSWDDARMRVEALHTRVQNRVLTDGKWNITLQYNPDRIISTAAKTDSASIAKRPCFLCAKNQPKEQQRLPIMGKYNLCVNPYPILKHHFTLSTMQHMPQEITPHIMDMCQLAKAWNDKVIFCNGAHCGASAPDHMHFQVADKNELPLQKNWGKISQDLTVRQSHNLITSKPHNLTDGIYTIHDFLFPLIAIKASCPEDAAQWFQQITKALPTLPRETEPRMNVFAWMEQDQLLLCIIPRTKHRPNCYGNEENGICISPGCVDVAGLLIAPIKKDFDNMQVLQAIQILQEVTLSPTEFNKYIQP